MYTVENILATKDSPDNVISPDVLVIDALKKLISVNLSYLIVYENDQYVGIFSERDYTRKLVVQGRSSRETNVRDVMTTEIPEVSLADTVEDCMYQMNTRGTRYLAAYNNNNDFAGIITIHDLLRTILANKQHVFDDTLTTSLIDTDESGKFF